MNGVVFFVTIKNSLFYLSRQSHVLFYDQFPQYWQFSNHPKILQCIRNCRFLFRRAFRLSGILRLRFIIVFSLNNAALLFYLCDIQAADFQAVLFQHIRLDLLIGCTLLEPGHIHILQRGLHTNLFGVNLSLGKQDHRLNMAREDRKYVIYRAVRPT